MFSTIPLTDYVLDVQMVSHWIIQVWSAVDPIPSVYLSILWENALVVKVDTTL